ncbi:hypothetical protein KDA08_01440 [Candidatus Saccharibacteria bacterium]|nr:hypothetical protein [Candidatus Saccharibacteria bacterium]
MDKQSPNNKSNSDKPKTWSNAELRRVARVFELLIRIDNRKKGSSK